MDYISYIRLSYVMIKIILLLKLIYTCIVSGVITLTLFTKSV